MSDLDPYVNRTVRYVFHGEQLCFALSHALFSSFTVDQGTSLLLKTVAKRVDLASAASVLDVGCGVGVIGICLKRKAPHLSVLMQDRDALAVDFSRENAVRNGAAGIECACGLALSGLGDRTFDLIASNWPAKAGPAVLADFCRRAPRHLSGKGIAAVVIVHTLADRMEGLLRESGHEVLYRERTAGHAVFHFGRGAGEAPTDGIRDDFAPYGRTEKTFTHRGVSYGLRTVYGLPDFDTIGFETAALMDLLVDVKPSGDLLFWNPGQGHIGAFLAGRAPAVRGATLCSRDILELETSRRNLEPLLAVPPDCLPVSMEGALAGALAGRRYCFLAAVPHPVPGVRWQPGLLEAASRLLDPGGWLCVAGTSTEVGRFLDVVKGFRTAADKRERGTRAVLLRRGPTD